jgi:formylglycine-generating enzyme required for sulfatase activity
MFGNLWQWCHDWRGDYDSIPQTDPVGPATGTYHVGRGGNYYSVEVRINPCVRNNPVGDAPYLSAYGSLGFSFRTVRTEL